MEKPENFALNSQGRCFLCLDEAVERKVNEIDESCEEEGDGTGDGGCSETPKKPKFFPIHCITQYLGFNMGDVIKKSYSKQDVKSAEDLVKKVEKMSVLTELCESCEELVENYTALVKLQEMTRLELITCTEIVKDKLMTWERQPKRKETLELMIKQDATNPPGRDDEFRILVAARDVALEKCQLKLGRSSSDVSLSTSVFKIPLSSSSKTATKSNENGKIDVSTQTIFVTAEANKSHEKSTTSGTYSIIQTRSTSKRTSSEKSKSPSASTTPTTVSSTVTVECNETTKISPQKRGVKRLAIGAPSLTPRSKRLSTNLKQKDKGSTSKSSTRKGKIAFKPRRPFNFNNIKNIKVEKDLDLSFTQSQSREEEPHQPRDYDEDEMPTLSRNDSLAPHSLQVIEVGRDESFPRIPADLEIEEVPYNGSDSMEQYSEVVPVKPCQPYQQANQSVVFSFLPSHQPQPSQAGRTSAPEPSRRKQNISQMNLRQDVDSLPTTDSKVGILQLYTNPSNPASNVNQRHQCRQCNMSFAQLYKLQAHLRLQHNNKPTIPQPHSSSISNVNGEQFACKLCRYKASAFNFLRNHYIGSHYTENNAGEHTCSNCKATVATLIELHNHERFHCIKKHVFKCDLCQKEFRMRNSVYRHKKNCPMKQNTTDVQNPSTSMSQTNNNSKEKHQQRQIPYPKPEHSFSRCPRTEQYICKICNVRFVKLQNFNIHFNKHHGPPRYRCYICNRKGFRTMKAMRKHGLKCMAQMIDQPDPSTTPAGEAEFRCKECNHTSPDIETIKWHIQETHLGSVTYTCTICTKKFHFQSSLKRHMDAVHFGITYPCVETCGKAYNDRSALSRHAKECPHFKASGLPIDARSRNAVLARLQEEEQGQAQAGSSVQFQVVPVQMPMITSVSGGIGLSLIYNNSGSEITSNPDGEIQMSPEGDEDEEDNASRPILASTESGIEDNMEMEEHVTFIIP